MLRMISWCGWLFAIDKIIEKLVAYRIVPYRIVFSLKIPKKQKPPFSFIDT